MLVSDIKHSFDQLLQECRRLIALLELQQPSIYLPDNDNEFLERHHFDNSLSSFSQSTSHPSSNNNVQRLAHMMTDFFYKDGQDGRETRSFHGVINATQEVITKANQVNVCKDTFRLAIQMFRRQQGNQAEGLIKELQKTLIQESDIDRKRWGYSQLKRVHLKQVCRHIPILEDRPEVIGFSWYVNGKSLKKVSRDQAFELLIELGESKPHIRQQIDVLAREPKATQLVQIQSLAPIMRANIRYANHRRALNCSLPIFVPAETSGQTLPTIREASEQPPSGRTRKVRNDGLLEETPLLKSLRIHRLRERTKVLVSKDSTELPNR